MYIYTYSYYLYPSHPLLLPGVPSSSSSFISPSTTAFSADSEHTTESSAETEETATEMEAEPTLEPPSAAAARSASVMAATVGNGGIVDSEHQVDLEEEQRLQQQRVHRRDSDISHTDPGFLSLSEPGKQCLIFLLSSTVCIQCIQNLAEKLSFCVFRCACLKNTNCSPKALILPNEAQLQAYNIFLNDNFVDQW